MANFPERLKELRLKKNLTQKSLGELVGLSERGIQSYEIEERKPTIDKLEILADFFGVSTDYLLGRENYWQDSNGNIKVEVPVDIFNLDTDELKKKLGQE